MVGPFKTGKSDVADSFVAEHIKHCYTSIIIHTKVLLTMTISHSDVPESFGVDIIIPIPKVKSGDHSSPDNSIPITFRPIFSKLFELVLIDVILC